MIRNDSSFNSRLFNYLKRLISSFSLLGFLFLFIFCGSRIKKSEPKLVFQNGLITSEKSFSESLSWGDYDNDGYEDLFISNGWGNRENFLFRNDGKGSLVKVHSLVSSEKSNSLGSSWIDFDHDGDLDLYLCNKKQKNSLFVNDGKGEFNKLENSVIVEKDDTYSTFGAWEDYDSDGLIDLFVTNYDKQPNALYKNLGNGNFKEINGPWSTSKTSSLYATWTDFNKDGWPDLIVCNSGKNEFYVNRKGTLTETKLTPSNYADVTYGATIADINNDGWLDLLTVNWTGVNRLFINNKKGDFELDTIGDVSKEKFKSEGSGFADYDNDGDLDLLISNDGPNSFFVNHNGILSKSIAPNDTNDLGNSNAVTWNDFDQNGTQDLFIANGGDQPNQFYKNQGNENNWILVQCTDRNGAPAIGTKIYVQLKDCDSVMTREVSCQSTGGYGGNSGFMQHFGFRADHEIDFIRIEWKNETQKFTDIDLNKLHRFQKPPKK